MLSRPVYVCDNIRTPIGRYGGSLSPVRTDDLAAIPIRALLCARPQLRACIDEVILGCANQAGEDNRNIARMASLLAGCPVDTPGTTVNRLCGSGLDALGTAARAIASDEAELIIAGGVESMSRAPLVMGKAERAFDRRAEIFDSTIGWRFINPLMEREHGVDTMPQTAENVAEAYDVSREAQDAFALRSQQRAQAAQASGRLGEEIVAVTVPQGRREPLLVEHDEHPRANTTPEGLAALKAPFRAQGTVTAGNASGVNDGAAALVIASARAVSEHGLTPSARILTMATAGVAPRVMGIGPAPATRKALAKAGLELAQMDVIELNEAFASQALAVLALLGLEADAEHVNPNGGAIALGHPLGMSGARLVMTAARELHRRGGRYALVTMCVGVGQGIAMVLERTDG